MIREQSIVDSKGSGLTKCTKCGTYSVDEEGWCYNGHGDKINEWQAFAIGICKPTIILKHLIAVEKERKK